MARPPASFFRIFFFCLRNKTTTTKLTDHCSFNNAPHPAIINNNYPSTVRSMQSCSSLETLVHPFELPLTESLLFHLFIHHFLLSEEIFPDDLHFSISRKKENNERKNTKSSTMGHPTAIFLSPPDPNFRCGICLDVFDDPVSLLHCGHTFCRSCLDSSLAQTGRRCPECRTEIDIGENDDDDDDDDDDDYENPLLPPAGGNGNVIHPVRVIKSAIDNSLVRCVNGCLDEDGELPPRIDADADGDVGDGGRCGCDWTGPLSSWHLHSSTTCPVAKVRCPIPGCGHECPRASLRSHVGSADCVKAAVVSQVEAQMDGFLADLRRQMRREVQRRVRELSEEKEAVEARLVLESDRRLELQDENAELQQEVCGLRREVKEMKRTVRGLVEEDHHRRLRKMMTRTREEGGGGEEEVERRARHRLEEGRRTARGMPEAALEDASASAETAQEKSNERKRRRRDTAAAVVAGGGASSVSPARSSDDGNTATASSSETAEGDGGSGSGSGSERRAKRRRKKKKRQEMRLQRRRGHLPDDDAEEEECGRLRAISSEYFD